LNGPVVSRRTVLMGLAAALPTAAAATPRFTEIAPGVFGFQGVHELMRPANEGAICNIGVVIGGEAIAVVDSGGTLVEAREIVSAVQHISDKPIRYLINTHMHPDHVFGNAVFRDLGAKIVGHKNLPLALQARAETYLHNFRRELGEELMKGVEIVPPSVLVEDRMELDLGGRALELRAWKPAHTDNDVTIFDRQSGTLFCGDLAFMGHLPTLDGSLLGWMKQLDELAAIKATAALTGHGPVPAPWPEALAPERKYFDVLVADLRKAIAAGTPMAQAMTTAAKSEAANWQLFDDYNERNAADAFAELEWE
jgi:quinoprotein relay system zinc metallohydrolase 2